LGLRLAYSCIAVFLGVFTVSSAALAAFSGRTFVSPSNQAPFLPSAGVDADGDVLYAWDDLLTQRIVVRPRSAAGALGPVRIVSPPGEQAVAPQVAVAPDGDALILWLVNDGSIQRIRGRTRSAAGALGPMRTFATGASLSNLSVKMDADGDALVLWLNGDHLVQVRHFSKENVLGATQVVEQTPDFTLSVPQMAVAPNGLAHIAWLASFDGGNRLLARTRHADGTLGVEGSANAGFGVPIAFRMAISDVGRAMFVVMQTNHRIDARRREVDGEMGGGKIIGTGDATQTFDVTNDPAGNAVIMWNATDGVNARPLPNGPDPGPVKRLAAGDNASGVGLLTLPDRTTVLVWMTVEQSPTKVRVFAQLRRRNGTYAPAQLLSPVIPNTTLPFAAAGAGGDVAVSWVRQFNSAFRLETIFGP
jgi:hypothetical protein